jgi:hypothetical protein
MLQYGAIRRPAQVQGEANIDGANARRHTVAESGSGTRKYTSVRRSLERQAKRRARKQASKPNRKPLRFSCRVCMACRLNDWTRSVRCRLCPWLRCWFVLYRTRRIGPICPRFRRLRKRNKNNIMLRSATARTSRGCRRNATQTERERCPLPVTARRHPHCPGEPRLARAVWTRTRFRHRRFQRHRL